MARIATDGLPSDATPREQLRHMWDQWVAWIAARLEERRALAHLGVAEDLSGDSRAAIHAAHADIAVRLRAIADAGPMRDAPLDLVLLLMSSIADATIDDLMQHPDPFGVRSGLAFDAMWRALAG